MTKPTGYSELDALIALNQGIEALRARGVGCAVHRGRDGTTRFDFTVPGIRGIYLFHGYLPDSAAPIDVRQIETFLSGVERTVEELAGTTD